MPQMQSDVEVEKLLSQIEVLKAENAAFHQQISDKVDNLAEALTYGLGINLSDKNTIIRFNADHGRLLEALSLMRKLEAWIGRAVLTGIITVIGWFLLQLYNEGFFNKH